MLLAPNGKQSNLTLEQYELVRTPQFKAWFGDWENDPKNASKVVDENGEPLVVYHGTKKIFNKFLSKYSNQGVFWFSSNKDKILSGDAGASSRDVLIEVFLNAKKIAGWEEYENLGLGQIEDRGFESIKLDDDYVMFDSKNIKLADGTNTTFDMNNDDIRYKRGGRTIAQTPAPKKDRIHGSKVNKVGSASSEKSAKSIVLSQKIIDSLKDKLKEFKDKHPSKDNITLDDLKAVYRRGLGAYSSSHRPTISGGVPNSRNAWAMARVNKFLLKAGGTKVKAAYVQDDDLMKHEDGGQIDNGIENFGSPILDWSSVSLVHETSKANVEKIKRDGFVLNEKNNTNGIYTIPYGLKDDMFNKNNVEIYINLKPNSKILWTNTQYPSDFYVGYGNEFYKNIYKQLNQDWENTLKNQKEFLGSNEQRQFCRKLESWLKENGYCGVQQGGEIVITNLSCIESIDFEDDDLMKYEDGGLIAPNGKPSKLTPEQYKLVRTPQFKAWFGDWENDPSNASKVVDENGEPLVVYHGSRSEVKFAFSEFNVPEEGVFFSSDYRTAIWFSEGNNYKLYFQEIELPSYINENTSLKDLEKYYKDNIDPSAYIEVINVDDGTIFYRLSHDYDGVSSPLGKNLQDAQKKLYKHINFTINDTVYGINYRMERPFYEVFLNIRKPYKIDAKGKEFWQTPFMDGEYAATSITSTIKSKGKNDGVIIKNTIETTQLNRKSNSYIVFNAKQIKLADGTNTTFDMNSNDIRYAKGGKIVVDDKDILKFKKIGVADVYEIEAIKDIGLQGINFDKNTISKIIKENFENLLGASNEYLIDEDSEAITRAIQNDINVRKEQGDSEQNIKMYESYLTNERERMRYLDSYRDTQNKTIQEWVSYLGQSDYSDAFKYLILKSVLEFNYDYKTNKLIERSNKTIRNFTNFDAGTLSQLYASNSKFLLKDYVELQAKNVDAIIKSKDVVKQSKNGYWIKFNGGSGVSEEELTKNASELSQLVQNTYWCTKTNAYGQLRYGDFYVYVTKGEKELFPRIAIRMDGDKVGEVRGNKSSVQDIEDEMLPIAEHFLVNNIPNDSGKKWLDSITYNKKCVELKQKLESIRGLYDGCVEEIAYLKCDERKYTVDYSNENGNFQSLYRLFFELIVQGKFGDSKYKIEDFFSHVDVATRIESFKKQRPKYLLVDLDRTVFQDGELYDLEIVFGEFDAYKTKITNLQKLKIVTGGFNFEDSNITSLGELKVIGGNASFGYSEVISLGKLQIIGGDAHFNNSKITSLGKLQSIGKDAYFDGSNITSLGELKSIGGNAFFEKSEITSLGKLESINRNAYFGKSKIISLGELKSIGRDALFNNSKITSLGELKVIGGNASFSDSEVISLGKLQIIGGNAIFTNSKKITSLGKLESIGRYAYFDGSNITSLGELKSIGGDAYFDYSKITSLGKLESIGRYGYFSDSNITSLGELKSIGGNAYFNNSKITSLGKLKSIGLNVNFSESNITSLGELKSIGGRAYFDNSKIESLGELETIGGKIYCRAAQLDMFLNIPNLKFHDVAIQKLYDEYLKLNLGGMINEDFRINRGGYRSNQSFANGGELSNNDNAIDNRGIGRDEFTKNRSKARAIIKDYANSKPFQVASAYNKEYGFPTLTMHEYKPSEKELQTKIANLYPHLQDVYSPTYEEGELERSIFDSYKERFPQLIEEFEIKDYEDLVKKSYEQLIKEIDIQYNTLPIKVEFHTGDKNYENSSEMFDDVINYNHMWVFLGGEDHPALGQRTMDSNGLTANDKFRAVHDYYGHVVGGFEFGKNGEENAWIEHSKMLSPLSQWALSTESRGQNSYVNYSGINEEVLKRIEIGSSLKKRGLELHNEDMFNEGVAILDTVYDDFVFAQQKATLLPQPYTDYSYYHQPFIDYVPQKLKTKFKDGGSVKYEISDYYDLKLAGGGDIKTKSILMDKIGLNEGNADYLISRSPKLAIWFGDALVNYTTKEYENVKTNLENENIAVTKVDNKKLALDRLNYTGNYIRLNYGNAITTILDWLQHPLTPKQNLRELKWDEALNKAIDFHDELEAMEGQVDFVEPRDNTIIMTFPKTQEGVEYYWVVIPKSFCSEESKRMGHCGRTQYGNNLLSLRSIKPYGKGHTINDSHVTIAYLRSYSGNYFYQVKGKKNQKPSEKYYPYIYDLIVKYIKEDKFDGFRSEYDSEEDYGYEDMTNEQLEYLLKIDPQLFDGIGEQILLYERGILKQKPNLTFTSKFSIGEIDELIETPRMRDNFIMRALEGEFYYRDVPEYDFNEILPQLDNESDELLFEYISKITKEPLEKVRENGVYYYFENANDYDESWQWVSLLGETNMQLENDAYNTYLYNKIKEALEEYGNVLELDVNSATLEIDLYKIASIEEIKEAFDNYDKPENAFIYLVNDARTIEKPNLSDYISDYYYPDYSLNEFNEVLRDRLASGYAKGGEIKHINPNNMKNQILKMPSLRKSDFVPNTKIILKEDVFNDNNNHVGTRYFYLEVIDTIGKMVNLKVLNSMGVNPILKNITIQRPISNLLAHGRLFGSSMAKGGELNPDDKEVKEYFAHDSGNVGGVLVGKRHSEGGIQATNKSTGLPLEMEGGEVVITRNAVSSTDKHEFDGKMMTNREILSKINESGGGVSFAEGGDLPENISCKCSGKKYKYGGEELSDYEIIGKMSNNYKQSELEKYGEMEIGEHKEDLIKFKNGEIDMKTLGMNIARKHIEENPNYYK